MNLSYQSTRGTESGLTASQAILKGLADDGGLFMPTYIPKLEVPMEQLAQMSYQEVAYEVMSRFLTDFTEEELKNGEYGGVSSGSYNYGNSNPELEKRIQKDLDEFLEEHPGLKAEEVPSDLLTASGSGLDPHISPKAAEIQIPYVAENAGLSEEEVKEIVDENTEHKVFGIFGEERVNVLKCNLAIANAMGILE